MILLFFGLGLGTVGVALCLPSFMGESRDRLEEMLLVFGAVLIFFAVGFMVKGLGIPSPLDGILVPPPLPK